MKRRPQHKYVLLTQTMGFNSLNTKNTFASVVANTFCLNNEKINFFFIQV